MSALPQSTRDRVVEMRRDGETQPRIAVALGISPSTVNAICKQAGLAGRLGLRPVVDGFEIKSIANRAEDGSWVKQVPERGPEFEMPPGQTIKEISFLGDAEGRQVLKWTKTREAKDDPKVWIDHIMSRLAVWQPAVAPVAPPCHLRDDLLTTYAIGDHHLGMLAWARETGVDYDIKIAEKVLKDAMDELVSATPDAATAVVLNLGDFFHADGFRPMTPASGNLLDVDSRYPKVVDIGIELQAHCVERALQKHSRVILVEMEGNHDPASTVLLRATMRAWYRNEPRVEVPDTTSGCWFYQHGRVMLAAHHGHKIKAGDMPGHCAAERPRMWGDTDYRFAFMGHVHHREKLADERRGMVVEAFNTLAGKDAWSAGNGYHSWRSMSALTFNHRGEFLRNIAGVIPEAA